MFNEELVSGMTDSIVALDSRVGELERKETLTVGDGIGPFRYEIHVDINGQGDFTSVKAACDYVAAHADVGVFEFLIWIHPGFYDEPPFSIPELTTLWGLGGITAIGPATSPATSTFITAQADNITLRNLQIEIGINPSSGDSYLLDSSGANLTLDSCRLSITVAGGGSANVVGVVRTTAGSQFNFLDCEFTMLNVNVGDQYVLHLTGVALTDNFARSCRIWRSEHSIVAVQFEGSTGNLYLLETTIDIIGTGDDLVAGAGATIYLRATNYDTGSGAGNIEYMYAIGAGTVSSVGLVAPTIFTVSGSPVTGAGDLALALANQAANAVWAGPSAGGAVAPTFRALVADDIPSLNASKINAGIFSVSRGGSGLSTIAADNILYSSALDILAATPITVFGRSLIDDADAATARTTLGLAAGGAGDIWVEKAGDTMAGNLAILKAGGAVLSVESTSGAGVSLALTSPSGFNAIMNFNSPAGNQSQLNFNTSGSSRWIILKNQDAESGSNTGSNFSILRRTDGGLSLSTPIFIERATGFIGINRTTAAALYTMDILGTFRVDATTGGVATLYRTDTTAIANDSIGRLEFANNDVQLTTQNVYGYIEVQASASIVTDAARGKMLFAVTPNTAASSPVVRLTIEEDGRIYGSALHNNAGAVTGTTNQYVASGTYTPTLNNTANVAASTAFQCQWIRAGNVVTVSGRVDIDPTLAIATVLGISLPIASNLGTVEDCAGVAHAPGVALMSAAILGSVANDRAEVQWIATDLTNQAWYFAFTYEVI